MSHVLPSLFVTRCRALSRRDTASSSGFLPFSLLLLCFSVSPLLVLPLYVGASNSLPAVDKSPVESVSMSSALSLSYSVRPASSSSSSPRLPGVCLVDWGGRWGNHVYELMFIVRQAVRHGLAAYVPTYWDGYELLNLGAYYDSECPLVDGNGRPVQQVVLPGYDDWGDWADNHPLKSSKRGDIAGDTYVVHYSGYYQYQMRGYLAYRHVYEQLLRPKLSVEAALLTLWHQLLFVLPDDVLLIGVHIRHGDFCVWAGCVFKRIPIKWYHDWLLHISTTPHSVLHQALELQQTEEAAARAELQIDNDLLTFSSTFHPTPICAGAGKFSAGSDRVHLCVLLCSDDIDIVSAAFRARHHVVVTAKDLLSAFNDMGIIPSAVIPFYLEWWLLTRTSVLATSQSSYSHTASLFNVYGERGSYWRPDPVHFNLSEYVPWNSHYQFTALSSLNFSYDEEFDDQNNFDLNYLNSNKASGAEKPIRLLGLSLFTFAYAAAGVAAVSLCLCFYLCLLCRRSLVSSAPLYHRLAGEPVEQTEEHHHEDAEELRYDEYSSDQVSPKSDHCTDKVQAMSTWELAAIDSAGITRRASLQLD